MELDQAYVWITTRRLKPGTTREELGNAWRPSEMMVRAYECYSPDSYEVVGISIWDSPESRDRYRLRGRVEAAPGDVALCPRGDIRLLRRARAEASRQGLTNGASCNECAFLPDSSRQIIDQGREELWLLALPASKA
jgi:hypothetical protein